mgnify:CR=1 FL=1
MTDPLLVDRLTLPTTFSVFGEDTAATNVIDLAKCENCCTSPKVLEALKLLDPRYLFEHWDAQDRALRAKLAELHGVPVGQVFLVSGGMGGIDYAFRVLTRPGGQVGLLKPDFPFWWDAQRAQTQMTWLESPAYPFAQDIDQVAHFIAEKGIPFIIFSNPHAGTGVKKSLAAIVELVRRAPDTFFVVDEADAMETDSAAFLTTRHENLLIIRSFSKFYGLAGLRIGYVVVPPSLVEHFRCFINPLEVTSIGIIAATAVLDDLDFHRQTQERVRSNLRIIEQACAGTHYRIVPDSSCFACYLSADEGVADPCAALERRRVKLSASSFFGLSSGGRINLCNTPELVLEAAKRIREAALD